MSSSTNRWNLPNLGCGIGLRTKHYRHILDTQPDIDWFEILTENYLNTEGRPLHILDQITDRYPVAMHGVAMSVGSVDPLNRDYLRAVKALADRTQAVWMGDHVCWTGVQGRNSHDLLPMPYTDESLAHIVERIRIAQDVVERPLVMENPSTYITFAHSTIAEEAFIARMADAADCALLLDVNNVYVTCRNHGLDPIAYLDAIPAERVVQIHLAGHSDNGTHCVDTHDDYVRKEVWDLYEHTIRRMGPKTTLIEWDDHIPDFDVVHGEALKAKAICDRYAEVAA